MIKTRIKMC